MRVHGWFAVLKVSLNRRDKIESIRPHRHQPADWLMKRARDVSNRNKPNFSNNSGLHASRVQPLVRERVGGKLVPQEAAHDLLGEDDGIQCHDIASKSAFLF